MKYSIIKKSDGFTLLEAVAAILLIGLILISFSSLILASKKTGVASEKKIDATYIAQHELENVYNQSKNTSIDSFISNTSVCTTSNSPTPESYTCSRNLINHPYIKDITKYKVTIMFTKSNVPALVTSNFYNVIVEVEEDNNLKSKMEGLYEFK